MATSTQGESDATSVKTYPSVQKTYPNEPVGQFTSMTSSYAESMPSIGDFEAAYDIWLNKLSKEVMFWVDNHGQTPAGTKQGTVTLGGLTWTLYATGGVGPAVAGQLRLGDLLDAEPARGIPDDQLLAGVVLAGSADAHLGRTAGHDRPEMSVAPGMMSTR